MNNMFLSNLADDLGLKANNIECTLAEVEKRRKDLSEYAVIKKQLVDMIKTELVYQQDKLNDFAELLRVIGD